MVLDNKLAKVKYKSYRSALHPGAYRYIHHTSFLGASRGAFQIKKIEKNILN